MRRQPTSAEKLLWYRLRNRQIAGLKFRGQEPTGPYIADFVAMELQLVIELDGGCSAADSRNSL
jgi:very-short-patch-repair endonuclease